MSDEPKRIYLQQPEHAIKEYEGCTWCSDRIDDTDTEYIRNDLYAELQAQVEALEQKLEALDVMLEWMMEHGARVDLKTFGARCGMVRLAWFDDNQKTHSLHASSLDGAYRAARDAAGEGE